MLPENGLCKIGSGNSRPGLAEPPARKRNFADTVCKISNHAPSGACDDFRPGGSLPAALVPLRPAPGDLEPERGASTSPRPCAAGGRCASSTGRSAASSTSGRCCPATRQRCSARGGAATGGHRHARAGDQGPVRAGVPGAQGRVLGERTGGALIRKLEDVPAGTRRRLHLRGASAAAAGRRRVVSRRPAVLPPPAAVPGGDRPQAGQVHPRRLPGRCTCT